MLFQFRLAPVEEIGEKGSRSPTLNWYFLTDGWYWMEVGGHELFRYTRAIQEHWARLFPRPPPGSPYDHYMIARYWEDLLEMLPAILDPVPADLAEKIAQPQAWQEWHGAWRRQEESGGDNSDRVLCVPAVVGSADVGGDAPALSSPPLALDGGGYGPHPLG